MVVQAQRSQDAAQASDGRVHRVLVGARRNVHGQAQGLGALHVTAVCGEGPKQMEALRGQHKRPRLAIELGLNRAPLTVKTGVGVQLQPTGGLRCDALA